MSIEEERIIVAKNMYDYGGSFVQKLGEALISADQDNMIKIKMTWPLYWETYLNFKKKGEREDEEN